MHRQIKYTILAALMIFGIGQSAYAVTEIGPIDPLTGFPVWVRDANNLQLQPCGEPPPPLGQPGCVGFESADPANDAFVLGNIAEFSYYRAEAAPVSNAIFRIRLQVQGADLNGAGLAADSVIGNEVLIRWRGLPGRGVYTFTTPFGTITQDTEGPACGNGANFPNCTDFTQIDALGAATEVPPFASTLAPPGAVTHFMSNTTPPGAIPTPLPGQDANLIFLGDFLTAAALNPDNFIPPVTGLVFSVTPPAGVDLGAGAGATVSTDQWLVEGLTIDCDNNQPALAATDTMGVEAQTPTAINVAANDQGNQDGIGNTLAFDLPLRPDTASVATAPAGGNAAANGDGTITYTANAGTLGADAFTYTVQDGCLAPPGPAQTATVNIFVEDLGVTTATLRVKQMKWRIEGQTSDSRVDNIMTLHAGGDGTGPVIGTAAVDPATGQWSFEGNSTADPGTSGMISCRSSNGALLPDIPISLR